MGMEILRQGDRSRTIPRKRFECENCGGVFVATSGEYRPASYIESAHDSIEASCECPVCKKTVYLHYR